MQRSRIAIIAAIGIVAVIALAFAFWPDNHSKTTVTGPLQAQLSAKVKTSMELLETPAMCAPIGAQSCVVHCTATAFGMDPSSATAIGQVTTAYAYINCHDVDSDNVDSTNSNVIALHFTSPPTFEAPSDGSGAAGIAHVFPPALRDIAHSYVS